MFFKYKKNIVMLLFTLFAATFSSQSQTMNDGSRYAQNSVLASGNWTKIKTQKRGFYKITFEELEGMGLTDPAKVKIYGYGGNLLDEDFSKPYVDDLPEVAVWMEKGVDDVFNAGDFILFYAEGMTRWVYNPRSFQFEHDHNPYSGFAYFFVTEGENGKRPETLQSLNSHDYAFDWFNDYFLHEKDEHNLIETGREFYGESFKLNNTQSFDFNIPGIIEGERATLNFIAKTSKATPVSLSINGTQILSGSVPTAYNTFFAANEANLTAPWTTSNESEQNTVTVKYDGVNHDNSYLNFIKLVAKRRLQPYGAVTFFRNILSPGRDTEFTVSNVSTSMIIFDVTDESSMREVKGELSGATFTFSARQNRLAEYAIVDITKSFPSPEVVGKISNQDLHSLERADMVIVVQPVLQKYAEQLAKLHYDKSRLTSLVVNPEKIYNEFSSGKPDATAIRRFTKMFHDRANSEDEKIKYLLLFGDGIYDNKFIENKWESLNTSALLLTYQTKNGLSETTSNVIEDYFGLLDDNEGVSLANEKLDVGIGRIPVRNTLEAESVVKKIAAYMADENLGIWKNSITFLADDAIADKNSPQSESVHMKDTKVLIDKVESTYPEFIVNKIFMDAFERVTTPQGGRYPDAQRALLKSINDGQLVLNYMGHGSTRDWSHEYILKLQNIEKMVNEKQALWITATCDFSRFDAENLSGGEAAFLNPKGGAIGLFSTVRVAYARSNMLLATGMFNNLFAKQADGEPLRLGDILRNAKAEPSLRKDPNKLNFVLIGDPALRLAYAKEAVIEVTEINGQPVTGEPIQIQALSNVTVKGRIVNENAVVSDFSGMLDAKIFDSKQLFKTRDNANADVALEYEDYINTVYSGKSEINDGLFEFSFVAPKDILYSDNNGKMSFYAHESNGTRQAQGSFTNYKVYGTSAQAVNDTEAPVVEKIYLNNEAFANGGVTNSTPLFTAQVSDNLGINLSGSIGHEISATIVGVGHQYQKTFNLTNSFKNIGTSANKGTVQFLIPELPIGDYKLTFRVWDVYNNSTTQELSFTVSEEYQPIINEFFIYGNPAKDETRFVLKTNTPGANLLINFSVYNTNGALMFVHQEATSATNVLQQIEYVWNLVGNNGMRLNSGIYICRASITSDNKTESMKVQKLVVAAQ